ncbi:26S proteasome non-ATPase regulatory subunit [Thraustotheca clavata]|uniref:26S proteasome non-ATPase regulatory subunit n=1 Tax=Thraustotheca clavata TaxID=74557 RepID=A0A1V9ZDH1_9STRA|nr:26S proteasome non-ATPase regulatory subunit [Thraustotheca clavata]
MTLLMDAARSGDLKEVERLVSCGYNPNALDEDERTALHWAAAGGYLDVVEFLIEKSNVNHQDDAGWTPLMSATSAGHVEMVSYLLSKGANPNIANENGQIPLHYHKARQEIVEILLDVTSDINKGDRSGSTPLMRAIGGRPSREIVMLFLDHNAKLTTKDINGNTPLHIAVMEGHESIARMLIEYGAKPSALNNDKQSCLDLAPRALRLTLTSLVKNSMP